MSRSKRLEPAAAAAPQAAPEVKWRLASSFPKSLDTIRQLEAQLTMRHYEGFLK